MKFKVFTEHNKKTLLFVGIGLLCGFVSILITGGQLALGDINTGLYSLMMLTLLAQGIILMVAEYIFSKNYPNNGAGAFIGVRIIIGIIVSVISWVINALVSILLINTGNNLLILVVNALVQAAVIAIPYWIFFSLITSKEPLGIRIRYGFKSLKNNYWRLLIATVLSVLLIDIIPTLLTFVVTNQFLLTVIEGLLFIIGNGGLIVYRFYLFFTRGRIPRFKEIELEIEEEQLNK